MPSTRLWSVAASLVAASLSVAAQTPPERDPAVLFKQGVTFEQFLANAESQRTAWQMNAARELTRKDLVDRLKAVSNGLQILAIAEAACSDSVNIVPYLANLASQAGVDLRIVSKATGLSVAEAHPTPDGRAATPTIVLLRAGKEASAWVERPAVLQTWWKAMDGKIPAAERLSRKLAWYDWDRGQTSLSEIVTLGGEVVPDSPELKERVKVQKQDPTLYKVVLLNDDYTTMEFVIHVLESVFQKSPAESYRIMMNVHVNGRGIAGVYPWEQADAKVSTVAAMAREAGFPLRAVAEEA